MSDLKLKQMETKAIASLRQAMSTLLHDAMLPAQMTFPLGDIETEVGVYVFEVRVALKTPDECLCARKPNGDIIETHLVCPVHGVLKSGGGLAQIDQHLKEINPDIERKPDDPL